MLTCRAVRGAASHAHIARPPPLAAEYSALLSAMQDLVLEPCPPGFRPPFINHHFVVPKTDGSLRFILDAGVPNELAPNPPPFRQHGVRVCKGKARHFSWAAKLDIKHCFYNVPIEPASRRNFCIQLADGSYWQFTRLPMGFTWSSYIIHRLLRVSLASLGLHVTFYADDIVVWANTEEECAALLARARALLVADGWAVNDKKTVAPSQLIDILGVTFDLVQKACRMTLAFRGSLAAALLTLSTHAFASKRLLAQVAGSVAWGAVPVPTLFPLANPIFTAIACARLALTTLPGTRWSPWTSPCCSLSATSFFFFSRRDGRQPLVHAARPDTRTPALLF